MPAEIIIGIDPGYADAGFGVISVDGGRDVCLEYGSIGTPAGQPPAKRLKHLYDGLAGLITKYRPRRAALEKLYFSKNVKTALQVAEARGVIQLCFEDQGMICREFSPAEVKIAVCGYGGADKKQMQQMVKTLLTLKSVPEPDDAADALALALALAHTKEFDRPGRTV